MFRIPSSLFRVLAFVIPMITGCTSDPAAPTPITAPPLAAATWHVHAIGGVAVPAVVSSVVVEGQLEETVVDSAQLGILEGGRYLLRSWTSVYRSSHLASRTLWREDGSWMWADTAYILRSDALEPRGVIRDPTEPVRALRLRVSAGLDARDAILRPTMPPPAPVGVWRAAAIGDRALPATMYVFRGVIEDGREISSHFVVDSATLDLRPTGRYVHRVWYTEWEGEVDGPPRSIRVRWYHGDFGTWSAAAGSLQTESDWFQNHRMSGTIDAAGGLLWMSHGLTTGDEPVGVRYAR